MKTCAQPVTVPSVLSTVTTRADGSFALAVKPVACTIYKVSWPGATLAGTVYPAAVATRRIDVSPLLTLTLSNFKALSGKYHVYPFGRRVVAKGKVAPTHKLLGGTSTPGSVTIKAYRYKNRKWVLVKTAVRTLNSTSTYSWSWKPSARGTYRLQTSFAGDADHVKTMSPLRYVKVR